VLFLDELPEFDPRVLDSLRQPLENGEVAVSRANHRVTYPARFMLVAAMNPCRCGHAYEPGYSCKRGRIDRCAGDYQARISGPLMDRIDLRIEVPAVTAADLILPPPTEGSAEVAARASPRRVTSSWRANASAGLPRVPHQCGSTGVGAGDHRPAGRAGLETAARRRRDHAAVGTRLSSRACASPGRWPTSMAPTRSAGCIWPKALSYRALADDLRRAA